MAKSIFVIGESNKLMKLDETPYDSESILQRLLADYPDILTGSNESEAMPRRWLLVRREAPIAGEAIDSPRWSLDHLFVDQDAIPTLVEVKRATDSRIRREVVGQMLDYAANAAGYWNQEQLEGFFEATSAASGNDASQTLSSFLPDEKSGKQFWQDVVTNLRAGRVRLVFVSDRIPPELRRIVEFLNAQMRPAEVIAIEVEQYVGNGLQTLVPSVIGQSATIQQQKQASSSPTTASWNEDTFFAELSSRAGTAAATSAKKLLDWAIARKQTTVWGSGKTAGSFSCFMSFGSRHQNQVLFIVWTSGTIEIPFQHLQAVRPFDEQGTRRELRDKLLQAGAIIGDERLSARPKIQLAPFASHEVFDSFTSTFDWVVARIRESN